MKYVYDCHLVCFFHFVIFLPRAELYGQTADECADAYLHYGKTLIELARQEIGVFWNAVKESRSSLFIPPLQFYFFTA